MYRRPRPSPELTRAHPDGHGPHRQHRPFVPLQARCYGCHLSQQRKRGLPVAIRKGRHLDSRARFVRPAVTTSEPSELAAKVGLRHIPGPSSPCCVVRSSSIPSRCARIKTWPGSASCTGALRETSRRHELFDADTKHSEAEHQGGRARHCGQGGARIGASLRSLRGIGLLFAWRDPSMRSSPAGFLA